MWALEVDGRSARDKTYDEEEADGVANDVTLWRAAMRFSDPTAATRH